MVNVPTFSTIAWFVTCVLGAMLFFYAYFERGEKSYLYAGIGAIIAFFASLGFFLLTPLLAP
jgi:hypothetical protein